MEELTKAIEGIESSAYEWYAIPLILLATGALISITTGLVQIRRFPAAVRMVFAGAFKKNTAQDGTITPFQALSTALASTVGNGNIGGVATAIIIGGPGAIFWMWVCAAVGMATKYAEAVLGVHFRVTRETGELAAGPMYYITGGIPYGWLAKPLAYAFAFFGAVACLLGTGNMAQSNTVARTFVEAAQSVFNLDVPLWFPGILITTAVGLVLIGGIKRIAAVAEKLVPSMIVLYLAVAAIYILLNVAEVPATLALIISRAFSPSAAVGGFVGASVAQALAAGISRGVLSNEAGLGSAPIAHGVANVKHPSEQGLVGIFEVFVDTILVCSMTAFIILSSGLWTDPSYQQASGDLTAAALSTSIPFASLMVAVCSFLFGFSTLIGWCYYGEKCFEFLFGSDKVVFYRVLFTALVMVGSVISVPLVWAIGSTLNAFMAFPNLVGLIFLLGTVKKLTQEYFGGTNTSS
ncbi:MAG: sodium:alanine symporter family protein [Acidobacteriota bacterium]|nr:sodium:alanine symporter family protein [Acidobacteriota bacterium]|tara:strand:+ start:535 stop:1929 length:1395 start_codon:yes stop_codon:yes gene_type:complete